MAKGKKAKKEKNAAPKTESRVNLEKADHGAMQENTLPAATERAGKTEIAAKEMPESASENATGTSVSVSGPRKVSVAACAGGMFLALVLGLYLGTLLPGIIGREETPVAVAPVPQAPEPEMAAPGVDPQLKKILADLEKNAAEKPDSAPDWISLGNAYFDAGMPKEAVNAYGHALKLAPRNADVLTDLGIMYREIGEYQKAVESFRKAVEIDPGHQNAMFNEGVVLANDLHEKAEAARVWGRLLRINPKAQAPNGAPLGDLIKELH